MIYLIQKKYIKYEKLDHSLHKAIQKSSLPQQHDLGLRGIRQRSTTDGNGNHKQIAVNEF